ncbi:MAG: A24 family peptidase [Hyphomicrobiaceae bacterium]|nr:A24 family peptidase [Hyphomicrobiaceae bacterium]
MPAATLAITLALGAVLSLLSAIDIETLRLPDWLTLPLIGFGLAATYALALDDVLWRLAAAAAAYLLLFSIAVIFRRLRGIDALGLGDAKLFAACAAWVGFSGLPNVLLMSSAAGLLFAAIATAFGAPIDRTTRIPFGPFLAGAFWLTWLYGPHLLL